MRLEWKKLHHDAKIPTRKRSTDAAYDIAAIADVEIPPKPVAGCSITDVPTGLAVAVSDGWYYTLDGRSSLVLHGLMPYRGTVDAGYNSELKVCLVNLSDEPYMIHKGDRIAQLTIHKAYSGCFVEVEEFSPEYSMRGSLGWGSSGR